MRAAGDLLARALERRGACRIVAARERPWASATFVGAQHQVTLMAEEEAFLDGIEETDFDLGEYLLADIVVAARAWVGSEFCVTLEALTIEDWRAPAEAGELAAFGAGAANGAAFAGAPTGWSEGAQPTTCGTKRAFVPLAAA